MSDLAKGFRLLEDGTKAPIGSARVMNNIMITDRGGLANRPGQVLLGANNSNGNPNTGFFIFKKADSGDTQIIGKCYDDEIEYFDPDETDGQTWNRLLNQFTAGKEFDFENHTLNTEFTDYLYGCNAVEPYFRWNGVILRANGAYAGGAGTLTVDSVFTDEVYFRLPYDWNGSAVTVADIAGGGVTINNLPANLWADDQYNGFYVHILTGTYAGQIRLITDSAAVGTLTVSTFGGNEAGITFEIRRLALPAASGTLVSGTTGGRLTYTAVPTSTTITISAGAAVADNAPVTDCPVAYFDAPRGNRLASLYSRMYMAGVFAGIGRNSAGNKVAAASAGSVFVAKVLQAHDWNYSSPRVAAEGNLIPTDSGGVIKDIITTQEKVYFGKQNIIGAISHTQDSNDLAQKEFLKGGVGIANKFIPGKDDVYFFTQQNEFTSLGRVPGADSNEEVENIGLPIKRFLDTVDVSKSAGIEWKNRLLVTLKGSEDDTYNNKTLIWNTQRKAFEGLWDVGFFGFGESKGKVYGAESSSPNVYELFTGVDIVKGTDKFPIYCEWKSNWFNILNSKFDDQEVDSFAVEGYIKGNTELNFNLFKDYSNDPFLDFAFAGTEEGLLDAQSATAYLGGGPLGLTPLGAIGDEVDDEGRRHFMFIVYFPQTQARALSIGFNSGQIGQSYEIIRFGLNISQSTEFNLSKIKAL